MVARRALHEVRCSIDAFVDTVVEAKDSVFQREDAYAYMMK